MKSKKVVKKPVKITKVLKPIVIRRTAGSAQWIF